MLELTNKLKSFFKNVYCEKDCNTIVIDFLLPLIKKENFDKANAVEIRRKDYYIYPLYGDEEDLTANRMDIIILNNKVDVLEIKKDIDLILNKLNKLK